MGEGAENKPTATPFLETNHGIKMDALVGITHAKQCAALQCVQSPVASPWSDGDVESTSNADAAAVRFDAS